MSNFPPNCCKCLQKASRVNFLQEKWCFSQYCQNFMTQRSPELRQPSEQRVMFDRPIKLSVTSGNVKSKLRKCINARTASACLGAPATTRGLSPSSRSKSTSKGALSVTFMSSRQCAQEVWQPQEDQAENVERQSCIERIPQARVIKHGNPMSHRQ